MVNSLFLHHHYIGSVNRKGTSLDVVNLCFYRSSYSRRASISGYFLTGCFLNSCTQVFAWGCGPCLGTGSVDATSARPRLIDELQSTCVIDIAVGDSHCLALSKGWCSGYFCVNSMTW